MVCANQTAKDEGRPEGSYSKECSLAMTAPQPIEYQQCLSGVFEKKHYMECNTLPKPEGQPWCNERIAAEPRTAPDCFQRPLMARSRFRQQVSAGVAHRAETSDT